MDTITVERPSFIRSWKTTFVHLCTGAPLSTKMSLRVRIDFPQKIVFVLGIVLSILGIASIIVAVVAFSEKIWGHYMGTGLWCGISMFLTGLSGVVAGQLRRPYIIKTYLIMSVIAACLSAVMLVLSAGGLDYDSNFYKRSYSYKKFPKESTTIIHVFSLCLAIFGFGVSLGSVGVCIKYLFFEKANSNSSHQNSREIHNLMCTSNGGRNRDAPGLRTPLREQSFTRSTALRESTSSRIPLRESESVVASSSHSARFHSPRHGPSSSHGNPSSNASSSDTSRFLALEPADSRREQHCQDSRREHVDLVRRVADRETGTPASVRSDCSQGSYVAAVEPIPAASSDFPPKYDDLTPNIFGEDELPPYEEVIRELTDSSEGDTASDVDLNQERYINCPVASDPPQESADVPPKLAVVAAAALCKDDTQSHRPMSFVQSSSAPPFPTSIIDKRKSEPQMSKNICKHSPTDKSTTGSALRTSESHAGNFLNYSAVSEATSSSSSNSSHSNKLPKTVAELTNGHNPQGVTYHDFSGTNHKHCNHFPTNITEDNAMTGALKSSNQHKSTVEGMRNDREYIVLQDSYENCSQGANQDFSNADLPPIGSHFLLHSSSSKTTSPTKGSLLPTSSHHGDQQSRSQNKRGHPTSLSAKCEPAIISTSSGAAAETVDNPRGRSSSHSERSGVKLVPLPKDVLTSGGRSKPTSYYNRNKRELILPAKEFDPLPASMKMAEKLSLMGSPEKHRSSGELVHSRNKSLDCSPHKSDNKHQKSKDEKSKDGVLVCRPKARIDAAKSGMVRYGSDRSQRKFSASQAERMHQFRWSDSKKRIPLPPKLPSTVRDWDTNDHSQQHNQQKIVAEFSPASIFQCPPSSQSTNLLRNHDMKKISPSLGRKGINSSSKSTNPRDEIHVAPEDILNIRSKPDREGSAFAAPGNVSPEVRYVPRLFHKSPQKSCSSSKEPPRLATVVTTVPTTLVKSTSTSTSTINGSITSADSEEDDHDDSEPLYSNDPPFRDAPSSSAVGAVHREAPSAPPQCETPSAPPEMISLNSDSLNLKLSAGSNHPLQTEDDFSATLSKKVLPAEQAYVNISEAHTVIVPMARISPLTVNKSTDEIKTTSLADSSSPPTNRRISLDDSLLLRTKKPSKAASARKRQSDNICSTKLLKCYPSSDLDLAKVKGSWSSPLLSSPLSNASSSLFSSPPPLVTSWRHSDHIVNTVHQIADSRAGLACKPAKCTEKAEPVAITQSTREENNADTTSVAVSDNATSQQLDSLATATASVPDVVVNGNDRNETGEGDQQQGAAVVNGVQDATTDQKQPMYSLLL